MEQLINEYAIKLLPISLIFLILCILSTLFYNRIIGSIGEYYVKKELKKLPKQYLILNDILIQNNNTTHQIDHIVISAYGIFVIETKQYNGYIVGSEYDKKWKQNNKYYINNPIHQNYGHVKALENVLHLDITKFIPIICIPSTAKLRIKSNSYVLRLYELNKTIQSYKDIVLDNYNEIYKILSNLNIIDKEKRINHIKYIKNIKNISQDNICPKCGGKLVKRHGKYGEFMGCSNYPKCSFTKKK